MKKVVLSVFAVPFILAPAVMLAQSGMKPSAATYISDEEVKAVNALPGVDRTIRVVDVGPENFSPHAAVLQTMSGIIASSCSPKSRWSSAMPSAYQCSTDSRSFAVSADST